MVTSPLVSVIIPTYNRSSNLVVAIDSVLAQNFRDFELIIIDDGSTDNTKEMVSTFDDPRIRYFYQQNKERSAARNRGMKESKGLYISFLDSDDYFLPNHLSSLVVEIAAGGYPIALFHTGMLRLNAEGIATSHPLNYRNEMHPVHFIWNYFLFANTVCAHREIFHEHLFDERFSLWEDTHLWLRLATGYPFYQVNEFTVVQNIHEKSSVEVFFSQLSDRQIKQYIAAVIDLFDKHGNELKPYLSEEDMRVYINKKFNLFFNTCVGRKDVSKALSVSKLMYQQDKNLKKYAFRFIKIILLSIKRAVG